MELLDRLPGFPIYITLIVALGLGTVLGVVATSFLKIIVVIHIVKSALGLQEAPPTTALNALALILTAYIMAPVGLQALNIFQQHDVDLNNLKDPRIAVAMKDSFQPLREFLFRHSSQRERLFFVTAAEKIWPQDHAQELDEKDFIVLLPAFTTSQLKSAFEVGFLIYLPFIIIDLIISNVLLALGMIMVSPIVISLPFKLLLFVLVDGWSRLLHGLVLSYQ
ncbi:EscR/YscR/HrcR family type III secretion system export apparatus protein [Exilibacterium tricleocarpae]|uniref:EscR/YscR/HrcR family type III secretion system export apparatus protein n=1 Tax=Exilibacterium tricleocarpae TaxID=2591008 RepID=A0A545SY93_9GAMM|nr:type III secretion system export apparatus subunit SctR [Exilibacterium tricleocarpae]TQV69934.1 EscR/YscR/HrcR family type III secretion system export apparatus protein [Exilibacterium tricleocarpae]